MRRSFLVEKLVTLGLISFDLCEVSGGNSERMARKFITNTTQFKVNRPLTEELYRKID